MVINIAGRESFVFRPAFIHVVDNKENIKKIPTGTDQYKQVWRDNMDIMDIMKKHGLEVPVDVVDAFNKDFRTHYKSVAEHKKVKDDLAIAQAKIDSNVDFEGKFNTLQAKYNADIEGYKKQISDMTFDTKLDKALIGIEFTSGRVRDSVISEIKTKNFKLLDTGEIEGLNDHLKNLYNTEPDTFKNVDSGIHTWYGGSNEGSSGKSKIGINDIFNRCY